MTDMEREGWKKVGGTRWAKAFGESDPATTSGWQSWLYIELHGGVGLYRDQVFVTSFPTLEQALTAANAIIAGRGK